MQLPGPLVDADWLASRIDSPELVLADVRWYPDGGGRARYEEGHIPGAVFVDVDSDLASPKTKGSGRHPLPSPEAFATAMTGVGIGDDARLIAYDDMGASNAARLWWMLTVTGHQAAVLDGGIQAWKGALESGPATPRASAGRFTPRPWPEDRIVDAAAIDRLRTNHGAVVLDARAPERYRAEVEPIDPVAGHIPGARSAPWSDNLDPQTGQLRSPGELRRRYAALGVGEGREVAAYCGSGVTSCHDLLALEVAGIHGAKLYVGSWSEWITDRSRPVATGPEPD